MGSLLANSTSLGGDERHGRLKFLIEAMHAVYVTGCVSETMPCEQCAPDHEHRVLAPFRLQCSCDLFEVTTDFPIAQRNAARHEPTVRGSRHRLSVLITIPRALNCSGVAAIASACIRGVPEPSH